MNSKIKLTVMVLVGFFSYEAIMSLGSDTKVKTKYVGEVSKNGSTVFVPGSEELGEPTKKTVIYIHGFGTDYSEGNEDGNEPAEEYWANQFVLGQEKVVVLGYNGENLPYSVKSSDGTGAVLIALNEHCKEEGQQCRIVCHSMGCNISAYMASQTYISSYNIESITALSSSEGGSKIADVGTSKITQVTVDTLYYTLKYVLRPSLAIKTWGQLASDSLYGYLYPDGKSAGVVKDTLSELKPKNLVKRAPSLFKSGGLYLAQLGLEHVKRYMDMESVQALRTSDARGGRYNHNITNNISFYMVAGSDNRGLTGLGYEALSPSIYANDQVVGFHSACGFNSYTYGVEECGNNVRARSNKSVIDLGIAIDKEVGLDFSTPDYVNRSSSGGGDFYSDIITPDGYQYEGLPSDSFDTSPINSAASDYKIFHLYQGRLINPSLKYGVNYDHADLRGEITYMCPVPGSVEDGCLATE